MATAAVQSFLGHGPAFREQSNPSVDQSSAQPDLHHVNTTLNYYLDPGDGSSPEPRYVDRPNVEKPPATVPVTVNDISGSEDKYTLDGNGFQIFRRESKEKDFADDVKIKREYYAEIEQLLKDATGASRIFIFDHTIRRAVADLRSAPNQLRGPVARVHVDQSYSASKNRVAHHLPDEAETLLQGRYQIINVWRPIKPIYKDPLAVADAHSVPDSDLLGVPLIYPDRAGETYTVRPNPAHRWYFKYGQTPEEVVLIKCFDSKTDGRARRAPHTAFTNPDEESREGRESIEVRALIFHPEDRE